MIRKFIYKAGLRHHNPLIVERLKFLRDSETWSRDRLLQYQAGQCYRLLQHACASSSFYSERIDVRPEWKAATSAEAILRDVPTFEKSDLMSNAAAIQSAVPGERHIFSTTSGSSGQPLVFNRNLDWDAWHNASVFRGYAWHGVEPWDRNGYLWGYSVPKNERKKVNLLDELQNRFRLFSYDEEDFHTFCEKLRGAVFLEGYSSIIYELAKFLESHEELKEAINLKFVKGTSEKIHDHYQEKSLAVFGRKIVSEYGCAEGGILAFECEHGNMHLNMETSVVEEVDNKVLVTNLVSFAFPVIRYNLGDYVKIDDSSYCSCGRESLIISEVTGRVGKKIVGKTRSYPSMALYNIFKTMSKSHQLMLGYQVVQKTAGELTFRISQNLDEQQKLLLSEQIENAFGADMTWQIEDGAHIANTGKKQTDFISELS